VEYTLPATLKFFEYLGMREVDVMRDTSATYRLGTEFRDWPERGDRRLRPFGTHGGHIGFIPFHHFASRMRQSGEPVDFNAFSLNAVAARRGRFAHAPPGSQGLLSRLEYGLCLDRLQCAHLLRRYALASGVSELHGTVAGVYRRDSDGFIESLLFEDGDSVAGDLFIDCSGDQAWLIGETLEVDYLDWSACLPCNRMLSVVTEADLSLAPLPRCAAADDGWMLQVPLRKRAVAIMLFAHRHLSEEAAAARLLTAVGPQAAAKPVLSRFTNGRRARFWERNCIALGSAAGSLEPSIFSEFHLVQSGVNRLMRMFPDAACDARLAEEYNCETQRELENARDYLLINYSAPTRRDSEFWKAASPAPRSASFQRRLDVFGSSGRLVSLENETFSTAEWAAAWISADLWPETSDPLLDRMDAARLNDHFSRMSAAIDAAVRNLPDHDGYLSQLLGESARGTG
jgi:tryptophan halogenase